MQQVDDQVHSPIQESMAGGHGGPTLKVTPQKCEHNSSPSITEGQKSHPEQKTEFKKAHNHL